MVCHVELLHLLWSGASKKVRLLFSISIARPYINFQVTKALNGFCCSTFSFRGKNVIWLDVYGILMKGFVTSCQFRKPSWSGRVLHHPVSLGLGPHRPWKVCHSKNHFMSTLRVVRKLVCIYSVVRKAGMNCWRGIVEQRDIASFVSGE